MDASREFPESPADEIRRAASLMRERAEAATPGPWQHMCLGSEGCLVLRQSGTRRERGRGRVARFGQKEWKADHADAGYVAAMSPVVSLAVADWLDIEAAGQDRGLPHDSGTANAALRVARAYLGEMGAEQTEARHGPTWSESRPTSGGEHETGRDKACPRC